MPDFERIFDDLALKNAKDDYHREYVSGFIAGKTEARKQILLIVLLVFFIYVITQLAT